MDDVYMAAMCSNEAMFELMLDALRRGILISHGRAPPSASREKINLIDQKKRICQNINQLTHEQKLQVLLAVVRVAGFEAIGAHNNGCFVDITDWDAAKTKRIMDVMQFASK